MAQNLTLHIPEPCHENWNSMSAAEKGRHCLVCQKTVVDFTTMTDAQLVAYFKANTQKTCGRFRNDQLSRPMALTPVQKTSRFIKYLVASIMAMEIFTQSTKAAPVLSGDMSSINDTAFAIVTDSCNDELSDSAIVAKEDSSCDKQYTFDIPFITENVAPTPIEISCQPTGIGGCVYVILGYTTMVPDEKEILVNEPIVLNRPQPYIKHTDTSHAVEVKQHSNSPTPPAYSFINTAWATLTKKLRIRTLR